MPNPAEPLVCLARGAEAPRIIGAEARRSGGCALAAHKLEIVLPPYPISYHLLEAHASPLTGLIAEPVRVPVLGEGCDVELHPLVEIDLWAAKNAIKFLLYNVLAEIGVLLLPFAAGVRVRNGCDRHRLQWWVALVQVDV